MSTEAAGSQPDLPLSCRIPISKPLNHKAHQLQSDEQLVRRHTILMQAPSQPKGSLQEMPTCHSCPSATANEEFAELP